MWSRGGATLPLLLTAWQPYTLEATFPGGYIYEYPVTNSVVCQLAIKQHQAGLAPVIEHGQRANVLRCLPKDSFYRKDQIPSKP